MVQRNALGTLAGPLLGSDDLAGVLGHGKPFLSMFLYQHHNRSTYAATAGAIKKSHKDLGVWSKNICFSRYPLLKPV